MPLMTISCQNAVRNPGSSVKGELSSQIVTVAVCVTVLVIVVYTVSRPSVLVGAGLL